MNNSIISPSGPACLFFLAVLSADSYSSNVKRSVLNSCCRACMDQGIEAHVLNDGETIVVEDSTQIEISKKERSLGNVCDGWSSPGSV